MAIDEAASRDAVSKRAPVLALIAVGVAIDVKDAIDMVLLQTEEGTVRELVEVLFPLGSSVGLSSDAEIEAVLRQHLHVGVSCFKRVILSKSSVNFPDVAWVIPE